MRRYTPRTVSAISQSTTAASASVGAAPSERACSNVASWRWALVTWSLPVLAIAALLAILAPRPAPSQPPHAAAHRRWWPDWRNGMIWRLGLIFASCNSIYFATNGFVPVYLNSTGRADSISGVLAALNLGQLPVSLLLLAIADRVVGRAWPYALAGCMALVGVSGALWT